MHEKKIEFSLESYIIIRMRIMSDIGKGVQFLCIYKFIINTHTPSIVFIYSHLERLLFIPVRFCGFLQYKCVRRVLVNKKIIPQHS